MRNYRLIEYLPEEDSFSFFQELPKRIYPAGMSYASDINREYLHLCLVVLENEIPVARLAVYYNEHVRYQDKKTALIGNYECMDDDVLSLFIMEEAFRIIRKMECQAIIGPMNGSTWDHYRFKTSTNPPFLSESQNQLHYIRQFESCGFHPMAHYFSALDRDMIYEKPEWKAREEELISGGVLLRSINLDRYEDELKKIFHFNLQAFQSNEFYTPISEERFVEKYTPLRALMNPDYVWIAEDQDGKMIGYIFTFINLLNKEEGQLVIKTIARHPDRKWRGLGQILANRAMEKAKEAGCTSAIHAYLFSEGSSAPVSALNNGEELAKYALYVKEIKND